MPVFLQFKGWSGKDSTVPCQQLAKVFKLPGKKCETIHEWIAQGRTWKYSSPVPDAKGQQALAFFRKLGYEVEAIPADLAPGDVPSTASTHAVVPSAASATAGVVNVPTDRITAEHFEIPGLVWVLDTSPDQERQKNDRRLLGIPRLSVPLMILLTFATLGIYSIYWFTSRMDAINRLDSRTQLSDGTLKGLLAALIVNQTINILTMLGVIEGFYLIGSILVLVVTIVFFVQTFKVRRILLDHMDANFSGLKTISGFLTLLFSIWFLQYKINGIHDWYANKSGEDEELVLRSDTQVWVYCVFFFFVFPVVAGIYAGIKMNEALEEGGFNEFLVPGWELTNFYSACDAYWQDAGDDQECTLEIAADTTFPYRPGAEVEVTGSGTRETFYAEARVKGSDQVYSINGRGELALGDRDESFIITFDKPTE